MNISTAKKLLLVLAALAAMCVSAHAVTLPRIGAATADGRFLYVPDMARQQIRVIDANKLTGTFEADIVSSDAPSASSPLVQDVSVGGTYGGDPYCMAIDNTRNKLYVLLAGSPSSIIIYAYSIQGDGTLIRDFMSNMSTGSAPRGMALTPSGNYLYVTDNAYIGSMRKIHRIDISFTGNTVSGMIDNAYTPIYGAANALYSIVISPDGTRMFVSNPSSTVGCVYMFNIASETNVSAAGTISDCPMASTLRISPDGTKLYVRVNDGPNSSTNRDVRVFNVSDGSTVTDLKIPNPGNHVVGTEGTDGYDTNTNNLDEDFVNYDAGLAIKPTGTAYVFFNHYMPNATALNLDQSIDTKGRLGVSGDGMWHWNLKIRVHDPNSLSTSWEGNAGRGFHSADSMIYTSRNRLWAFYSNGGYVQSTQMLGPDWVSHYLVTSNEATVLWNPVSWAQKYQVQYYKVISGPSTVQTVEVTSPTAFITLEAPTSPLTQMSTYDVQVRAISPIGEQSQWTPNQYVSPDSFYTLEQVWTAIGGVDTYPTGTADAQVLFGPILSQTVMSVPYAVRYDLWYRLLGTSTWNQIGSVGTLEQGATGNTHVNSKGVLYYQLGGLTSGATYEVIMRSVDSTSGTSEWSSVMTFEAQSSIAPWIDAYNPGRHSAWIRWGGSGGALNVTGAVSYELDYRQVGASTWNVYDQTNHLNTPLTTETKVDSSQSALNFYFTGSNNDLTQFSTYEVKIRANYADGSTSGWSGTDQFYTWWATTTTGDAGGPEWVAHYNVTSHEAMIDCQLVNNPSVLYEFQTAEASTMNWVSMNPISGPPWANHNDMNPNMPLTGLKQSTTYALRARAWISGYASDWTPIDYFYTLERPWVNYHTANSGTTVYIDWGPEVSQWLLDIPNATGYRWKYRINGGDWTVSTETFPITPHRMNDTSATNLNFKYPFALTANSTYEVQMWAIDASGSSDCSSSVTFSTTANGVVFVPWVGHYNVTPEAAVIDWNTDTTVEPTGLDHYILSYSTNNGVSWTDWPVTITTTMPAKANTLEANNNNFMFPLTPLTTYEVQLRAVDHTGKQIGSASNIDTFHSFWQMWTGHFNVSTSEAHIYWGPTVVPTSELGRYDMQWKRDVDTTWIDYLGPPQKTPTPFNNNTFALPRANLNATLDAGALTKNTTYDVRTRAVD